MKKHIINGLAGLGLIVTLFVVYCFCLSLIGIIGDFFGHEQILDLFENTACGAIVALVFWLATWLAGVPLESKIYISGFRLGDTHLSD